MTLPMALIATMLVGGAQQAAMPKGMSHDEHMKQMAKDEALKKRGGDAMGFDQDATTHHFRIAPDGGSIEVIANDGNDAATVAHVRDHLQSIAAAFARGDFGKPEETHAEVPPGVPVMRKNAAKIAYAFEEAPAGGIVRIRTTDPRTIAAVHDFLRYQIAEHHTADLVPKR
jgi:hypothetical protein